MAEFADGCSSLRIPDHQYWCEQINCQHACPVHTDSRGYVRAIAEGNDEQAYLIARGPNPLASLCGRICGAPCESACRRGELDQPVSIRALKRYVCEQFGPESRAEGPVDLITFLKEAASRHRPRQCQGMEELLPLLQGLLRGDIPKVQDRSVGIIGSGPAGLAAAHDLALLGFAVTIYEMEPVLAGMLAVGVPEYRLPRRVIEAETNAILAMGVRAVTGCCVGRDVTLAELRSRHDAVIIAVGAKRSRKLAAPNGDAPGVIGGVEYLRDVSLGNPPQLGSRVVVIGGGNVAYDVGRTVLRQISLDAARTAARAPGVGQVYLCSLESLEEMPADDVEILEGDEEGILRRHSMGVKEILTDSDGHVSGVRFRRCLRVLDEQRRFNPLYDDNAITEIACNNVLLAIGQDYDLKFVDAARDGIALTTRGGIECDPLSGATSAADVFVAGDLAHGPKLLIHAVASGKAVARAIYERITGRAIRAEDVELHFPIRDYTREIGYEAIRRLKSPTIPVEQRLQGQNHEVERPYTQDDARREASRCLDCGVNTIFDGNRCILCGGCVDVCPSRCLRILPASELLQGEAAETLQGQLEEYPPEEASAIVKDETICIRCGLCAERCPTGAITMEQYRFQEAPYVGTIGD